MGVKDRAVTAPGKTCTVVPFMNELVASVTLEWTINERLYWEREKTDFNKVREKRTIECEHYHITIAFNLTHSLNIILT